MNEEPTVLTDYDCVVRTTERAMLVEICEREYWIPLSQVIAHDPDEQTLLLPEWLALEKGLI